MRAAPPVSYPLGPCFFQQAMYASITLLAVGVWCAWCVSQTVPMAQSAVALLLGAWGVWAWRDTQVVPAWLVWDGQAWRWETLQCLACEGRLAVQWDWQQVLLLRFDPPSGEGLAGGSAPRWMWLARGPDAELWDDLRRAVHGPQTKLENSGEMP
jgi:hypothetical protein